MNELEQRIFSLKEDAVPADDTDRRRDARTRAARPVYVQPADPHSERFEEVRTMQDFSRGGFYFTTERESYRPGKQLYVIPAFGCFNLEYLGEVVRVDQLPNGEYGIAVRLLGVGNTTVAARTATMAAFQSFALSDCTPPDLSQDDSRSSSPPSNWL